MENRALESSWTIPRPGETVADKYVIEAPCGRGGLAVVFSAIHAGLDRRVAIKVLLPEWAGDADVIERFLREGRAATRIKSEHVVRVFDVGRLDGGAPYLVLEYLEGHNLDDVVSTWGPLPVHTAIDWVLQAAEAIAEAHALGIVHRDLKPSNLFLTRRADGSACIKVIDFGLSKVTDPRLSEAADKLTRPNDVMGSPHYMAPEQLRATRDADARADLWALGAVLHELLTGQTPFRGETVPELCATVLTQPAPRISSLRANVPPAIEQAVLRCLEKDPNARFSDIAEMARVVAPYGTACARASCERIERVLSGTAARTSDLSLLPPLSYTEPPPDPWPSDVDRRVFASPTSAKVIVGSFFMIAGLGIGVFMCMYASVHDGEPSQVGVTAAQPTSSSTARTVPSSSASAHAASSVSTNASATPPATRPVLAAPQQVRRPPVYVLTNPRAPVAAPPRAPAQHRAPRPPPPEAAAHGASADPTNPYATPPPPLPTAPVEEDPFAGRK